MEITKAYKIPDFFIAGAAKSGTTALWNYLGQHPDIFMTKDIGNKELGYFCNDYGLKSFEHYSSYFERAKSNQLIGEACHSYLTSPESPLMIKQAVPNAKILTILRNPVDRSYSLYNWMVMHGYEYLSFQDALIREEHVLKNKNIVSKKFFHTYFRNYLYRTTGLYSDQVLLYQKIFGTNFKVLIYDDLKQNPSKVLSEVFRFLELDDISETLSYDVINKSERVINKQLFFFLKNYPKHYGGYLKIKKDRLNRFSRWISKWMVRREKPSKMKSAIEKDLFDFYTNDIKNLEKLLGRNLSEWKKG